MAYALIGVWSWQGFLIEMVDEHGASTDCPDHEKKGDCNCGINCHCCVTCAHAGGSVLPAEPFDIPPVAIIELDELDGLASSGVPPSATSSPPPKVPKLFVVA
jgi:hypothetical protein